MALFIRIIFTLLPLLGISFGALAAGGDRVNSEKIFWVSGQRESLPDWISQPQGKGRYIGVSDPCLDSIAGEKQAILRGWFLAMSCNEGLELDILLEEYQKVSNVGRYDRESMNYMTMASFESNGKRAYFKRGRSHHSIFGEYYLELIECEASVGDDIIEVQPLSSASISGTYLNYGYEKSVISSRVDISLSLSAMCNGEEISSTYKAVGPYGREVVTRTLNDDSCSEGSIGKLWYKNSSSIPQQVAIEELQTPLRNGIWGAVYESMIIAITSEPTYGYKIKQAHANENIDDQQKLIRSIFRSNVRFDFGGYTINNDKMLTTWSYVR